MNLASSSLASIGTHDAPEPTSSGRIWPMFVVALILLNVSIVGVTVFFAARDKSAAIEPDYYSKALKFDDTIRLREASRALGWQAHASLTPGSDATSVLLVLTLTDRNGNPLTGATVSAVAFANVRSGNRQSLTLSADPQRPGSYSAPIRIDRAGLWCLRLTAQRGPDLFTQQSDLLVPDSAQ